MSKFLENICKVVGHTFWTGGILSSSKCSRCKKIISLPNVFKDGKLLVEGMCNDYVYTGTTIKFNAPPEVDSIIAITLDRKRSTVNGDGVHTSYYVP